MTDQQWQELTKKFIEVRDALNNSNTRYAYRMAYNQPWKFYREYTIEEAIDILIKQYPD